MICFSCKKEIEVEGRIRRSATCPHCASYQRCCRNCRFYDTLAYNQCREPAAERVVDKEKANFCDHFTPNAGVAGTNSRADEARKKLDALFPKKKDGSD